MIVAGAAGVAAASNVMVGAIQALYGMAKSVNEFIDDHIEQLKQSESTTISRSGRVLEQAKIGFGLGFTAPIIVIAVGQLLLGNPLSAAAVVVSAPFNPIAMTCAAIGAIHYGWNALDEKEQGELLEKVSNGLEIGCELVRSVIKFVIDKIKSLLSQENIDKLKYYVGSVAAKFNKRFSDITGNLIDKVKDNIFAVMDFVDEKSGKLIDAFEEKFKILLKQKKDSAAPGEPANDACSESNRSGQQ